MPSARSRLSSISSSLLQDVPEVFSLSRDDDFDISDDENKGSSAAVDNHQAPAHKSLSKAVFARRSEYVRSKHVRIKVGTWNVAGFKGTEQDVGAWFIGGKGVAEKLTGLSLEDQAAAQDGGEEEAGAQERRYDKKHETIPKNDHGSVPGNADIDLYVLALQEIVDLGSAVEAFRPYADSSVVNKWKAAVADAIPEGYTLVAEQQLIGLLMLIYASPQLAPDVSSVSTTSVGTGLMNFMGNKGAVAARIVLGDAARLVFVNCHLAAGTDRSSLERRNGDFEQIVSRVRFEPIQDATGTPQMTGERIGDEDLAFWCGDLNYRMQGIPGDDVRRILMLHSRHEYDLSQPSARKIESEISKDTESVKHRARQSSDATDTSRSSSSMQSNPDSRRSVDSTQPSTLVDEITANEDPTSLQTTLDCLLPHDELQQQMNARKAFHDGWREGPITFLPTYKYDPGSVGVFDSSEKRRAPSWCDRILYRTRKDRLAYEARVREEDAARRKDDEMKANGTDLAASDEEILYDYDPETDGTTAPYDEYDEDEDDRAGDNEAVVTSECAEDDLALEYYLAHQRVLSSDHKPLDAVFTYKYEAVVPELRSRVHAEVVKELDRVENEGRPNVTVVIDRHHDRPSENYEGVCFGEVRWSQTKHRSLTVANTSRVSARFSFIDRPLNKGQASGIAPQWLLLKINEAPQLSTVNKTELFTLEPGESCNIDLSVGISATIDVQELNDGLSLDDILVMRVENGRDHFIPIKATWLATSLGRSIDKLIRIPEGGVRKMQRQQLEANNSLPSKSTPHAPPRKSTDSDGDEPIRCSAPRELFRLTEAIDNMSSRLIAEWEMMNPSSASFSASRDSLDSRGSVEMSVSPWHDSLAWPFDAYAWTERHTSQWDEIASDICNALDEDQPLDSAMPKNLPKLQKLYALSSFLLFFLKSMPGNVISTDLWAPIEAYLLEAERGTKKHASLEDQRTALQEILAQKSPNSITFVLIMSMLERILVEIPSNTGAQESGQSSPNQKNKRASLLSKHNTGRDVVRTRQSAEAAIATVFAGVMIETPLHSGSEKARHATERRKIHLVEIFLKRDAQSVTVR